MIELKSLVILLCCTCLSHVICAGCPEGEYMKDFQCKKCTPCLSGKVMVKPCTATNNTQCECPVHKYWNTGLVFCKSCTTCSKGQYVVVLCTKSRNRICRNCPSGTFASIPYAMSCQTCSHCEVGELVGLQCNSTHDTVCVTPVQTQRPPPHLTNKQDPTTDKKNEEFQESNTNDLLVVLLLVSAGVVIIILLAVCCMWGKLCPSSGHRKKHTTETSYTDESEVYPFVRKPKFDKDPGLLVRDLSPLIIEKLARLLNPPGLNDWKQLASTLGFNQVDVNNFQLVKNEAFQSMVTSWGTRRNTTVYLLYTHLLSMRRDDCCDILERVLQNESA